MSSSDPIADLGDRFEHVTAAREFRTGPIPMLGALPLVAWEGVRYSVPPECLGQVVECRVEVDTEVLEIRCAPPGRHPRLAPTRTR